MLIYTQIEYLWIYCLVSLSLWLIFFLLVYNSGQVDKQNFECCWCHAGGMIRYKISLLNNAFRHTEKRSRRKVKIKHTPCLVHTINNDTCLLVNRLFFYTTVGSVTPLWCGDMRGRPETMTHRWSASVSLPSFHIESACVRKRGASAPLLLPEIRLSPADHAHLLSTVCFLSRSAWATKCRLGN